MANDNELIQNEEAKDLLTFACLKRIDLNYKKKNFHGNMIISCQDKTYIYLFDLFLPDLLRDIKVLEKTGYDVYLNCDLFLKKM